VVAAVIQREGRILIGQRRNAPPHPLEWEFPGGKVEPNETPEAALVRELEEELDIRARLDCEITRYEYQYPGRAPILLIFYRVFDFDGEPANRAFERIEWVTPDCLGQYNFLEGDRAFVRSLEEQLS